MGQVPKSCSGAWMTGTGRPGVREELCQADGGTSPGRGGKQNQAAPQGRAGSWEATGGAGLSTWTRLAGEHLQQRGAHLPCPPTAGRLRRGWISITPKIVQSSQNLAACRLHFAHGHVSFSLCKIFSETLEPIFASQVISHKNYLENKEGLEAQRICPPEAMVLADPTRPAWPELCGPGSHFPAWPPALPRLPAPVNT